VLERGTVKKEGKRGSLVTWEKLDTEEGEVRLGLVRREGRGPGPWIRLLFKRGKGSIGGSG